MKAPPAAPTTVSFTFELLPGFEVSVRATGTYDPGCPESGFCGPPENYDPGEPAYFSIDQLTVESEGFTADDYNARLVETFGPKEGEAIWDLLQEAAQRAYESAHPGDPAANWPDFEE